MTVVYELSVVIAVQFAEANLPEIMRGLDPASHPDVEFLFCATGADPRTSEFAASFDNVSVLNSRAGSLIPELWRHGIMASRSEKIALGTAHCIPAADWVSRLIASDITATPAIGGEIINDEASDARGWAIYLLRYLSFSPPQKARQVTEIAADNALYRRKDILQHGELLETGFWEPSFHARFRNAGMVLEFDPGLRVVHCNRYTNRQFFSQRLAHGKAFGLERSGRISKGKNYMLLALSPLLPLLFLGKIFTAVVRHGGYNSKLIIAFPWLLLFLLGWGMGEASGYLSAVQGQSTNSEQRDGGASDG